MKNVNSFQIVFYAADCVDSRFDARLDAGLNVNHVVCVDDSVFNDKSVDDNWFDIDSVYDNSVNDGFDRAAKF
jgi:hypothetical protein